VIVSVPRDAGGGGARPTPDRDRAPAARSFGVAGALVLRNRGHSLGEFQI